MGVLNVTPDSFSDGGKYTSVETALQQVKSMVAAGATVIDIGGESTRPGAERVPVETEILRVVPVIEALKSLDWARLGSGYSAPQISVDTMNHQTALAAVAAGAHYVNDVSGGLADPQMLAAIAPTEATYILGHWRGHSAEMDRLNQYSNPAKDVAAELADRLVIGAGEGLPRERIILDPGLGFAKDAEQNWQVLSGLNYLFDLGLPVLIGASRKRFLAAAITAVSPNGEDPAAADLEARDAATAALTALLAHQGVWGFRVHNVAVNAAALAVAARLSGRPRGTL